MIDCDVIQADGGTRTASITGAWIALRDCLEWMRARSIIKDNPLRDHVAAVSCGIFNGKPVLDLDYAEDSAAQTDANFVITGSGGLVEIQATAEVAVFSPQELQHMIGACAKGRRPTWSRSRRRRSRERAQDRRDGSSSPRTTPAKLWELQQLLGPYGVDAVSAGELGLAEPEETETTFRGNALLKARAAAQASGLPAFADNSGLCVDGLDGAPGVYSARWGGENRDFGAAIARVERELKERGASRHSPRISSARWRSSGRTGTARNSKAASTAYWCFRRAETKGFGYDPIFLPDGLDKTFGEMMSAEKHALPGDGSVALSHRARAFQALARAPLAPQQK